MKAHWSQYPRHFLDTETTGLDPLIHEIIEIAVITQRHDGKVDRFVCRVRPAHIETAHPRALEINGYDPDLWQGAPVFSEIADELAARLKWGIIIGHNVEFDLSFLRAALQKCGSPRITFRRMCTQQLALEHLPGDRVSMRYLRGFFGLSQEGAHRAMKDTEDCRTLFRLLYRAGVLRRLWWWIRFHWLKAKKKPR